MFNTDNFQTVNERKPNLLGKINVPFQPIGTQLMWTGLLIGNLEGTWSEPGKIYRCTEERNICGGHDSFIFNTKCIQ